MVMKEVHKGSLRGHFATKITQRKILDVRYWWLTMYKDVHHYCKSCDGCQRTGRLATQNFTKLVKSLSKEPFMKWGLDFVGPCEATSYPFTHGSMR
jgi:hypothetical protein